MKEFDIEKIERKNVYKVPDNLFENIQERVLNDVQISKKVPIFKLNWAIAVAASLALIFGTIFVFNSEKDSKKSVSDAAYAISGKLPKTESEIAYETLKSDLTSVENNNQTIEDQKGKDAVFAQDNETKKATNPRTFKTVSKQAETQMNEYLDSFSNSEIAELANNSNQDVYLDLYN